MKRRQLVSCDPQRWEALKRAHEEFEQSELKRRLDEGWKIQSARVKRPRIKANPAPTKITIELSGWGLRKTISRAEYEKEWQGKPGVKVIITFK